MSPEEVLQVIQGIGEMLEPSAQAAWDIAMRQVGVEAVQFLWAAILSGAIVVVSLANIVYQCVREYAEDALPGWIGLVTFTPVAFLCASAYYGRMVNPAYYVISLLTQLVP
jgi:hypothetical protein